MLSDLAITTLILEIELANLVQVRMKLVKAFAFLSPYSGHILPVWILLSSAQCSPVLRPSLVISCRGCLPDLLMFEPVWFIHSLYSFTHKRKKYFHTSLLFSLYAHMHLLMCIPSSLLFQKFYAIVKLDALLYQSTNDILHINGVHFLKRISEDFLILKL